MNSALDRGAKDIRRKLDILRTLLAAQTTIYPPLCNCAIKSRDELNHIPHCPYRTMKEVLEAVEVLL